MSNPNSTALVIDINRNVSNNKKAKWEMHGCLVLRPSKCGLQAYGCESLNINEHGQMNSEEIDDRLDVLRTSGFRDVTGQELYDNERPDKFIIDMKGDKDYNLDEIQVFNNFQDHPHLMEKAEKMQLREIAQHMLGEQWRYAKKLLNTRGNIQLNQGSNHVDMNNRDTFDGMNTANVHKKLMEIDGLKVGSSMDDTMFESNVIMTDLWGELCVINKRPLPFGNQARSARWAAKECERRGYNVGDVRHDASAWLYTGPMTERVDGFATAKCKFHKDQNDGNEGARHNICISQIVDLKLPGRSRTVQGRSAINQFMKGCNGSTFNKVAVNEKIWGRYQE